MAETIIGSKLPPIWVVTRKIERATFFFWGGVRQQNGFNHERAVYLFERALRRDAQFLIAAYLQCWSYIAQVKFPEAIDALRACIIKHDELRESYASLESTEFTKPKKLPGAGSLGNLYETLIVFNALLVRLKDKPLGEQLLMEYLINDPTLPEGIKKAELLVRGLLGEGNFRLLENALRALFISIAGNLLSYFEALGDSAALKRIIIAQLKVLEGYKEIEVDSFLKMKRGLQMPLAELLFETGEREACREITEDILREDPTNEKARQWLGRFEKRN